MRKPFTIGLLLWGLLLIGSHPAVADFKTKLMLGSIRMPPGFKIDLYADNVPEARSMALSPSGTLFVGTRKSGRVYAVLDQNGDRRADRVVTIAEGLTMPNGVALWEGDLYVAEISRILRYPRIEESLEKPPAAEVVFDRYPKERSHGWKFIRFGPDGRLYVPVGAPCNICQPEDPIFATITRINRDGSQLEIVARGVRNTVGFDWHPATGMLWFTENGRDWMGDDQPPDELNYAPEPGMHFGFPLCHGVSTADPEFGSPGDCDRYTSPAITLGPHVAALGMRFYTGRMFPIAYQDQIFIAEHGSWNRSSKTGYRVSLIRLQGDRAVSYEPFAQGWLLGDMAWGRPVDVEVMQDGSLLVSDDKVGAIYRIYYTPPTQ